MNIYPFCPHCIVQHWFQLSFISQGTPFADEACKTNCLLGRKTLKSFFTLFAAISQVWTHHLCSWRPCVHIHRAIAVISNTKQAKSGDKMQFSWAGIRLTSGYSSDYKSILVISVLIAICDLYCWVGNAYNQACTVWDTRGSSVQVSHFITTSCAAPWCKLYGIRGKEYL